MSKEITIVDQVKELATVSGIAFEFEVQELTKLSKEAEAITSTEDDNYKEIKSEMVKKRNYIKNYCLNARRDIKSVADGISGVENQLYDIFVPEENRLIEISKAEKLQKEREERELLLPAQRERLASIGDDREALDENLLEMDGAAFETYYNQRLAAKNEADRAEIDRQNAEIARKQAELADKEQSDAREAETKEREETARKEGEKKAKQDAKDKEAKRVEQERIHQEQLDKEAQEAKEKAAEDARAAQKAQEEATRKLEASKKFVAWLIEQGYSEQTKADFKLVDNGDSVTLYKILGNYKK